MPHGLKTFSAYAAAGISGLLALAALNIAADKLPLPGLKAVRDFITRPAQ
jgi:hypothetical protein